MTWKRMIRILIPLFSAILVIGLIAAVAAANIVPESHAGEISSSVEANELKPDACASLDLTDVIVVTQGGGTTNGTSANELILGTDKHDAIDGKGGDDCLVGGAKNDDLVGGAGNDILLGGPDKDSATGGPGTDVCYGGGGGDKLQNFDCEEVHLP